MTANETGCARTVRGLTPEQFGAVADLVGDDLAQVDEPAVALAFGDFRAGMDELREAFAAVNGIETGGDND
ncbi:hypothetical protein AL755_04295 [Arthrobacter sp. ERGS1:01]|uniref:hypothetical protein n=1 Tax=Arthrobacter sp. ERGS1:01 TaxID=1704044 RepID=UPI0006B5B024|nr:hypothetical protein [Arthrobacter sp. ERGS1:01]ALE04899.1 hypothetical protein AL755_04295 [Arthrobacter sp. ERGS1:01]